MPAFPEPYAIASTAMLDRNPGHPEPHTGPATPEQPQSRKPALPALTGLRTLLAISIMFFHFTPPHPPFLDALLGNAYVFVGFVLLVS